MEAFTATMEYSSLLRPFSTGSVAARAALALPFLHPRRWTLSPLPQLHRRRNWPIVAVRARATDANASRSPSQQQQKSSKEEEKQQASTAGGGEEVEEVEEELPWIEEKALDLVEFTGTVTQAVPGPRIGESRFPWLLALPLAYLGITFVFSVVKTVKKFTSPRAQRKRLVNKNATLLTSIDELFMKGKDLVNHSALEDLMRKTGFTMDEILRKYIRYTLNEKPFDPDLVVNLIHLRKASQLEDSQVAEVLNEVSRRIVKEKGPVVMDISGFTEKGFKRKLAVQALFGKILYLSELPEFCSRDGSLIVKEIFGVTDEDADSLRLHTLSATDDVESIKKMAGHNEATEPTDHYSSSTPDVQRESKNGI